MASLSDIFRQNPLPDTSFTISKLGLPSKGFFLVSHLNDALKMQTTNNCCVVWRKTANNCVNIYLLTECAYSRLRTARRWVNERRAYVTHKAFSHNCHLCQLFAFCLGVPFFLHTKDCAFILYIPLSFACLLCVEALWVQYKWANECCSFRWRTSGIMREMPLSMRVPIVSSASDGYSCIEIPLYEWWEKCRRVRKEGVLHLRSWTVLCTLTEYSAIINY